MKKSGFIIIGIVVVIFIIFLIRLLLCQYKKEKKDLHIIANEQKKNNEQITNYDGYERVSSLHSNKASTTTLVKFDGILYGKSYAVIDYAGGTGSIGLIDKLIDHQYVPKLDGETNTKEILYATVFKSGENEIILWYNNEYVLFEKI